MYRLVGEWDPIIKKIFLVEVLMNGEVWGFGEGKPKDAEQQAAAQALKAKPIIGRVDIAVFTSGCLTKKRRRLYEVWLSVITAAVPAWL